MLRTEYFPLWKIHNFLYSLSLIYHRTSRNLYRRYLLRKFHHLAYMDGGRTGLLIDKCK